MLPDPTDLLPHRGPWLLVRRLLVLDPERAVAEAELPLALAAGHFPDGPVIPGVILIEALAQTLLALCAHRGERGRPALAGVDRVRFPNPVRPPATVRLEVRRLGAHGGLTRAEGVATWAGQTVCAATLTGALLRPEVG